MWLPHGLITIRPACSPRVCLLTGPLSVAASREATALPPPVPDHLLKHQPLWGDKPHWNTGKGLAFRKIRGLPSRRPSQDGGNKSVSSQAKVSSPFPDVVRKSKPKKGLGLSC